MPKVTFRFILRQLYKLNVTRKTHFLLDRLFASIFNRAKILKTWDFSQNKPKKNLCIFSHFDPKGVIDDYVLYFIKKLSDANIDIIFVTTSPSLPDQEANKLSPFCFKVILRENKGRDFGAYKTGFDIAKPLLSSYEKLIIANDSVYGPLFDLTPLLNLNNNLDAWGATDSIAYHQHIQSYFIVFNRNVFLSKPFEKFWRKVTNLYSRHTIVQAYEIGFSKYLSRSGFKLGALCNWHHLKENVLQNNFSCVPYKIADRLKNEPLNPTHFFWNIIITDYNVPFIKRELLVKNPERLDISNWQEFIANRTQYDPQLITAHIDRTT